jgi:hypothetical protein
VQPDPVSGFSEDLDFTLLDPAHLEDAFLAKLFEEVPEWVYERTGLGLPREARKVAVYTTSLISSKDARLFRSVIPSKIFESMGMGLPILPAQPEGEAAGIGARARAPRRGGVPYTRVI